MEIMTRKQAMELGLKKYSNGKPCKHGHAAVRRTSTGKCIQCEQEAQKSEKWREYHKEIVKTEKYKKQREEYRKEIQKTQKYKDWTKTTHLKRTYGLSLDDYNQMCEQQDHKCVICDTALDETKCVDHCHTTGKVRSILCPNCNKLLGLAKESEHILQNAIKYIKTHNESQPKVIASGSYLSSHSPPFVSSK